MEEKKLKKVDIEDVHLISSSLLRLAQRERGKTFLDSFEFEKEKYTISVRKGINLDFRKIDGKVYVEF